KQNKRTAETGLTKGIFYYEVHVRWRLIRLGSPFLRIFLADISKKIKFFSAPALKRSDRLRIPAADTPKALTYELQLISISRFAHLCRSRPRGSIREQVDGSTRLSARLRRGKRTTRITISSFLASCVESITGMRLDWVL